jgi:hypothetical protein
VTETPHNEHRDYSPSASVTYIEPKWTSALALVLASFSLALSVFCFWGYARDYRELEREVRLQRMETDELGAALARAGIEQHRDTDKP